MFSKEAVNQLASLLSQALQSPQLQKTAAEVLVLLCARPEVLEALSQAVVQISASPEVIEVRVLLCYASAL